MSVKPNSPKTNHLILLVGTNPLPNYVAAKLLLNEGGRLYLLYSTETAGIADRLEIVLRQKAIRVKVDESDAGDIAEKMAGLVGSIGGGSIGLHYTGGTKVMAVHAHRALLEAMREHHPGQKPVCSYLDARSYEMKFDPQPGQSGFGQKVLLAVDDITLETLLDLHKIVLMHEPQRQPVLPESANALAQLFADKEVAQKWQSWCHTELRPKTWHLLKNKSSIKRKLAQVVLTWPEDDVLQIVVQTIQTELELNTEPTVALSDPNIAQHLGKPSHFCKWLDGVWLENYVLDQVIAVAEQCNLSDWGMSLDTDERKIPFNFEFDVAAMKGYQLFALSCSTTLDTKLAKPKLFEAYLRAHQFGGDEARIGLIIPHDNPKTLKEQVEESWNIKGKVRVFGIADFKELGSKLQDWFENAK